MKVLLYFEGEKILAKSGIGRALDHQKRALSEVGIEYTLDANCTDYDILHINTYGINSHSMVNKAKKMGKKLSTMHTQHRKILEIHLLDLIKFHL